MKNILLFEHFLQEIKPLKAVGQYTQQAAAASSTERFNIGNNVESGSAGYLNHSLID